jgi:hypothetical protein
MPTVFSILDPKLADLQARIAAVRTQLHTTSAFLAMSTELAAISKDIQQVSRYAELLMSEVLQAEPPTPQAPMETTADILKKLTAPS